MGNKVPVIPTPTDTSNNNTNQQPKVDTNAARVAMGLTDAEHTVIDNYVRTALGTQPEPKRSALTLYILQHQSEMRQIRSSRLNTVRLRVHRAQQHLQRAMNNNSNVEEINNRKEQLLSLQELLQEEMKKNNFQLLQDQWNEKLTKEEKLEWLKKANDDVHRAEEELRIYEERYIQLYRAVAYRAFEVSKKVHPPPTTATTTATPAVSSSTTTTTTQAPPVSMANNNNNTLPNTTLLRAAVTRPQMKIINGQVPQANPTENNTTTEKT